MQIVRPEMENLIRRLSQDIQFSAIECIKLITTPRPEDDSPHGALMSLKPGWNIETTWNLLLQTMLALKLLPDEYTPGRPRVRYSTGFHTLHHLMTIESHITTQQKKDAWFILGREEIPYPYANLICDQIHDTDRNAAVGMAAVLEGHTQAVSRIRRDHTANDETIYLSLFLLDMMCPRGWKRDREATDDMPRWIHELSGPGQWDFPNVMKFEITTMSGQPLQPSTIDEWGNRVTASWAPINFNIKTLLHILLQQHPLGSLTEFRKNSMIALQQHFPQGTTLTPHFFNHGETECERKSRKISHLIHRATGLQIPGTPLRSRHSYPCQDNNSHPARTGTSQRPEL